MTALGFLAKLVLTIILLWAFVYALVRELSPDPGSALSGLNTDIPTRDYLRAQLGLDREFLPALAEQLSRAARLDFGSSLRTYRPVLAEISRPFAVTGLLALMVSVLSTFIAAVSLVVGIVKDVRVSSLLTAGTAALSALPGFLVALMLAPWFPAYVGTTGELRWQHMILPSVALLLPVIPYAISTGLRVSRDLREMPWFETYVAFGFTPPAIARMRGRRWLLRGASNIAIAAFLVAFTGSVAVEQVCGLPGLGTAIVDAIDARDLPVILAITALTGVMASSLVLVRSALERHLDV